MLKKNTDSVRECQQQTVARYLHAAEQRAENAYLTKINKAS